MNDKRIDLKENNLYSFDQELLEILLKDRSSGSNIIWATENYAYKGRGFQWHDHIESAALVGRNNIIIKPRVAKSKREQIDRIKKKAEVFTPSWICNKQNNLIDNAWFGEKDVFNIEHCQSWTVTRNKISFPSFSGKTWEDYVKEPRLEISCGEAPYLVSRYDTVTGDFIELSQRIGLLDRKMRVVMENATTEEQWHKWTMIAFKSVYGFEWQGDNVLLARENLLLSYYDYYKTRFEKDPDINSLHDIAEIISWNIWQMDGLKFVIPDSCVETELRQKGLFDEEKDTVPCKGCQNNDPLLHTGIYCMIMDWEKNKIVKAVSLLNNGVN